MFTGRSQQNIFDLNGFKCAIYFGRCRCSEVLPDGKWRGAPSHKPPSSQAFGPACTFLPRTRLLFLTCSLPIIVYTIKTKLFIAFEKNWLVWYSLMILLRWSMCYWTNFKWKLSKGACTISFDQSHRGFFILSGANVSQLLLMTAHTWLPPLLNLVAGQNWFTTAKKQNQTIFKRHLLTNIFYRFSSATFSRIYFIDFQAPPSQKYIL